MTRRNNNVFLVGTPVEVAERTVWVGEQETPLMELRLRTDRPEITAEHQVLVRGRQKSRSPAGAACTSSALFAEKIREIRGSIFQSRPPCTFVRRRG